MKVDFEREMKGVDGQVLKNSDKETISLKSVSVEALMMFTPTDKTPGAEKANRYRLGMKINAGENEVTAEDVALIKKLIGEFYGPLIVGQAWDMLENKEE